MDRVVVTMPYIGRAISKNYYKFPNGGTRPAAKKWAEELARRIRTVVLETCIGPASFRVGIYGRFESENRPDIQNLFDLISDAVQDGLGVNDKYFTMADDGYKTGYLEPRLVITIEER